MMDGRVILCNVEKDFGDDRYYYLVKKSFKLHELKVDVKSIEKNPATPAKPSSGKP